MIHKATLFYIMLLYLSFSTPSLKHQLIKSILFPKYVHQIYSLQQITALENKSYRYIYV